MKDAKIFKHIQNRSLAHVMRYNLKPQHFPESVAEHSYFVAYIAAILCHLLEQEGESPNRQKALEMALVHDMEEMFSGDIVTPMKHYSKELEEAIDKVNREMLPGVFQGLPEGLSTHFMGLWSQEGEGQSMEAQIVKVADKLSLLAKCAEEVRVGNEFFQEIYNQGMVFLKEYDKPWWQKIKHQVFPA